MNAQLRLVKLGDIRPNPFRDIEHYPIDRVKVELLRQSYERTGFWDGYLMVRPVGADYEQPWGHHRVVAAIELWGKDHEIPVIVRDLSDEMMLAMMAHENNEHFAQYFYLSVMEPIEAVIKAYAGGRATLEPPGHDVQQSRIYCAPSFVAGRVVGEDRTTYTALSVGRYLGWLESKGTDHERCAERVYTAMSALELIERKVLTRAQFLSLTSSQAKALVDVTRATIKAREADAEAEARVHTEAAAKAQEQGNKRKAQEHSATAERAREQADENARKAAKTVGAQVAERLASGERLREVLQDTVQTGVKESQRKIENARERASSAAYSAEEVDALVRRCDKLATEDERERAARCKSAKAKTELARAARQLRERLGLLLKTIG